MKRTLKSGGKSHVTSVDRTLAEEDAHALSFSHSLSMKLVRKTFGFSLRSRIRARWVRSSTKSLHTQVCRHSLSNHGVSSTDCFVKYLHPTSLVRVSRVCYKERLWPSCESSSANHCKDKLPCFLISMNLSSPNCVLH